MPGCCRRCHGSTDPHSRIRLGELVESSEDAFCSRVHTVWREMTPPNDAFTIYNEKRTRRFPGFSLKAPYFLDTSPFGSQSASTGKFSLRSLAQARWDQILSTDMAISSALNFLSFGITIAYKDSWSVHTGLQSAG